VVQGLQGLQGHSTARMTLELCMLHGL
jgi:hypothetical protein